MPFFWNINSQINCSLYGLNIPFSFVVTNGKFNFTHSFARFGISPQYKWITFHAGYRQMTFSRYSLSDQTFLGAGLELHPGKFRFAAMAGRFRKAVPLDTGMFAAQIPGSYPLDVTNVNGQNRYSQQGSYSRSGYGFKIGVGSASNYCDLVFFKAKDNVRSLSDTFSKSKLTPEENTVLGLNTFQKAGKHVTFGFSGAASMYTYNATADTIPVPDNIPMKSLFKAVMPVTSTTQLQWAGEVNLGLNFSHFSLQTQYKRIEPYFRSMGIVSFLSDIQSLTISPAWSMAKQKIRFSNMFQFQNDNLNGYKQYTTNRAIVNSTISVNPSNGFGVDISYAGYGMNQQQKRKAAPDSIRVTQQSSGITLVPHLVITGQKMNCFVNMVGSYTVVNGGGILKGDSNRITNYYMTLNNSMNFSESGWSITAGVNYNNAKTFIARLQSMGATAGITKSLLKNRLSLSNTNTFLVNKLNGQSNGNTFSADMIMNYAPSGRHSISLTGNYLYSPANGIYNANNFRQTRIEAAYQYNF